MTIVKSGFTLIALALVAIALVALVRPMVGAISAVDLPSSEWGDAQIQAAFATVVIDPAYSHAETEHPNDMQVVRRCLDDPNAWKSVYKTEQPYRYLRVCYDGSNIIFQVVDRVAGLLKEKTAYIRADMRNLTDVIKYVDRVRYFRVKGGF